MSLWGSCRMISRSLHVPGSDSSALTTRYDGLPSDACKSGDCREASRCKSHSAENSPCTAYKAVPHPVRGSGELENKNGKHLYEASQKGRLIHAALYGSCTCWL